MSCINPALPAALVKCLYLLVCLPAKKENMAIEETFQEPLAQVKWGSNLILHLLFILCGLSLGHTSCFWSHSKPLFLTLFQVVLQLCRQPVNVERLVETQELQCLIIGLTSLWDQTSATWRHQASRVLKAVSAVATSNTVPSLLGDVTQKLLHEETYLFIL